MNYSSTREKTMRKVVRFHQEKTNPSFSSTLLDEIYRSIDDSNGKNDSLDLSFRDNLKAKKKQSNNGHVEKDNQQNDDFSFHDVGFNEKTMGKKVNEKIVHNRRQISPEFDRKLRNRYNEGAACFSSSTCSSDSSSAGVSVSSSETAEPNCKPKPKPIRTAKQSKKETEHDKKQQEHHQHSFEQKDGILKLKLSAMKIYSNLKKVKQPISPGARLSAFISSLFTSSNGQHQAKSAAAAAVKTTIPMCSSATSFPRSCLSKNTSCAREDSRKSMEKAVKFAPAGATAGEISAARSNPRKSMEKAVKFAPAGATAGEISAKDRDARSNPVMFSLKSSNLSKIRTGKEANSEMNRKTEHVALKQYIEAKHRKIACKNDEDRDDASDSSSDLFELDHLAPIGKNHRYCEELPVYATTRIIRNRVIR